MAQYVIYVEKKTGYDNRIFCGGNTWDEFHCIYHKVKIYRTLKGVYNTLKKKRYLSNEYRFYICDVEECTTGAELHIYWKDGVTVEVRYFANRKDAEEYTNENGCSSYEITPMKKYINVEKIK